METSKTRGYGEWGGYVEVVTSPLTSLFVVQSLWLRAREGVPASLGPEAQRETGLWPCGSTGFLGNRPPCPPAPQPAHHVDGVERSPHGALHARSWPICTRAFCLRLTLQSSTLCCATLPDRPLSVTLHGRIRKSEMTTRCRS